MNALLVKLAPIVGLLLLGGVLGLLRGLSDPFWWFSVTALLLAGILTWSHFGEHLLQRLTAGWTIKGHTFRITRSTLDVIVFIVLFALAAGILPELAKGHRPVNHDHPVHYFKAWQLKEHFLAEGRIYGWSHLWYAGYPAQILYPIGADVMVIVIWAMGLGFMSFSSAYAYAFLIFWFLQGWSLYAVGRATVGRWAGLLAGVFVMADTASFRFGGWTYAGEWGVWPNSLSVGFAMLGVAQLPAVLQKQESWVPVSLFGLWTGLGLISHPMQIMHTAIIIPVACLVLLTSQKEASRLLGLARLALGSAIGAAIGAVWVLPFLGGKDASENYGVPWRNAYDMGTRLHDANLLEGSWVVPSVLAVFGVLMLVFHRRFNHALIGIASCVFLATASTTFLSAFNLVDLSGAFSFIQYQRFSILLKPYAFLAAGFAIVSIFQALKGSRWMDARNALMVRVLVVAVLGLPILFGATDTFRAKQLNRSMELERSRPYRTERAQAVKWLQEEWAKKQPQEFWRVGIDVGGHEHGFTDLGTVLPMPLYKIGYTPAETFEYKMEARTPQVLKAVNVRYILATKTLPRTQFTKIQSFGSLHIYEFSDWMPNPFVVLEGQASVTLKSWDSEKIVLVADVTEPGRLQLNVSNFARWRAMAEGKRLTIGTQSIETEEDRSAMMVVPMQTSGEYIFYYEHSWRERVGTLLFLVGLAFALLLFLEPRRLTSRVETLTGKLASLEERHQNVLVVSAGTGVLMLVFVALLLAFWVPKQPHSAVPATAETTYDFTSNLHKAKVAQTLGSSRRKCPYVLGHHMCGTEDYKHVQATVADVQDSWRRCIWAHPEKGRTTTVSFGKVPRGTNLIGWYGIASTGVGGKSNVDFKVAMNDVVAFEEATAGDDLKREFNIPVEPTFDGNVQFQISSPEQGKRHFCFHAAMVDLPKK